MPNKMEEVTSKAAGLAKEVKATFEGLTGVFKLLAEQHGEVAALLKRAAGAEKVEKRLDLWSKIRIELISHERGELGVVYPAMRDRAELREFAARHDQEAGQLEAAISGLDSIDPTTDQWHDKLEALIEMVTHHIDEEENEWFPRASELIKGEEAKDLEGRFKALKEAIAEQVV
jgi:hypothetical protein